MEFDCNNVDENEKYAFLLGSAIKNEDSDQFFSIYDSIIPKDLPESQIKKIKKRVREIVDLQEEAFNDLVSKARHYSLASAGISTMSSRELSGQTWSSHCNFPEESEDEGLGSATQSQVRGAKSETSSLYSTTKCSAWSSESETRKCDEDLGLCNSSKATNSVYSLSDGSDSEGKGCFDYYPPQVKIRSGVGINLDYDEAYEVKSEHSSHNDINSPRSDISEGVEMVTFSPGSRHFSLDVDDDPGCNRRTSIDQDDFNTDGESDNEEQRMRDLYNQGYRPLMKDNNVLSTSKYATKFYSDRVSSSLHYPEVDQPIKFSSLTDGTSRYSRYSTLDDHGSYSGWTAGSKEVKVEKNIHKKDRPPFGGKEQFNRVANSIGSLITSVPDHEVKNMPEGRKLEMLQPEDNKKKKKKKKKDDVSTDQNGNPIASLKDTKAYRQMRESPSISEGQANYGTIQYSSNPHEQSSLHRDSEGLSKLEKQRRSKKNKTKEVEKKSEDVEHYVGNKSIEDLLDYIDGQNVSLKKSKKQSPSNPEDIPNKTQKQNKKSKDKKQKSPTPSIEEVETKGNNSAQSAITDQEVGSNNMGNLSGKTDVNTSILNGDIDGNYAKRDKISKPLLKDDKELVVSDIDLLNHHMPHSADKSIYCKESVKDKEIPKTNNKRVAAIETNTSDQKQKKGIEKSDKAPKSEKLEMVLPNSDKSENMVKVDDSAAGTNVTVKQKNSKNKKSKPTSPTSVKVENDVQSPEFFSEQSFISQILDQDLNEDSGFIFTDIEVPEVPKEDEFQVVGKKKKKPTKEISQPYQQNNYVNHGYKYGKRYDEKSRSNAFMNNKFPSPLSNSSSLQSENDGRARDLSPSAFPALCSGKGRQACSDGRRNSTGDVQIPSDTKSQDDGDKESVKSLPATKASNTIDTVTSPRINMSYAKMAAGVASAVQKTSSIGAEKNSSDPKITVWKGNARERRHSIGSSPDGVGTSANHTPSSSAAMSLKAGSQENLKDIKSDEKIACSKAVEESISLNKWNVDYPKSSGVAEHSVEITSERGIERESKSSVKEAKVSVSTARSVHSQPLVLSKTENNVRSTSVAPSYSADKLKKVSGDTSKDMTVKGKNLADSESKLISTSQTANVSALNVHKQESQKSRNNGTNNKKHKSVIFYDKRLEESTSSLDISFGFEFDLADNTVTSAATNPEFSSIVNYSDNASSVKKDITFDNTDQPARSVVQTVSCASITFNNNSILGQSSNSDVIETSNTDTSSGIENVGNKELNTDISEQIDKVSSKLVHLNGIVSQPQGQIAKVAKEMLEDKSLVESDTGNKPATLVPTTVNTEASKPHGSNTEVVYYGENVATLKKEVVGPSSTNGPTSYCGVINFRIEVEAKSNFYLAEAATYLTKEWNSTLKLQDKDPASVKVHGE